MKTPVQLLRLVVCSSVLLLFGCGATKTTDSPVNPVTVDKSDELAAAAMQAYFKDRNPVQALKLAEKAAKRAPERAELWWLQFQLCAGVVDCNTAVAEDRLLALDPRNAAIQLGALARAQRDGDDAAGAKVLDTISRSPIFQIYWNTLISKLARASVARDRKRAQPVTRSLNEITDWYSQFASATFGPILVACRIERAVKDANLNARCIRTAGLLLQGDTYIGESVGLTLARSLLGAERAQQIADRTAASQYQRDTASEIINAQVDREKLSTQLLDLMSKVPREQDVFQTIVRWGGGGDGEAPVEQ